MARRRGGPPANTLSPPDVTFPGAGTSTSPPGSHSPRSVSPSGSFTQFLSKPTKWFNRSNSANTSRTSISSNEPRASTSSIGRKPKISHPTDPRPILENLGLLPDKSVHAGSRSVLDLSLASNSIAADDHIRVHSSRTPSSPSQPVFSRGLGDLRSISRKPWSKSADDLGKLSSQISSPVLTPIDTTFHDKIDHYRNNHGGSIGSMANTQFPSGPVLSMQKTIPFPVISQPETESLSPSPSQQLSIQLSPPAANPSGTALTPVVSNTSSHVHSRSHSFTPRLASKLSSPKLNLQPPPSPKRKGSGSSDRQMEKEKEKKPSGTSGGYGSSRSPFPLKLGSGGGSKAMSPVAATMAEAMGQPPSPIALTPPRIVEPEPEQDSKNEKRTSQVVYHSGFANRLIDFSPVAMNIRATHSYMHGGSVSTLSKGWKPYKLVLKGSKLYFYKPPSDRSAAVKDLFPTELITVLEEEGLIDGDVSDLLGDEMNETQAGRGGKGRDDMRRRRAYWGRDTHPALLTGSTGVEQGTFEALVHEMVFATTFAHSSPPTSDTTSCVPERQAGVPGTDRSSTPAQIEGIAAETPPSRYDPGWWDFASTVLLSLPVLVGRGKFEGEFTRCCAYLISGATEAMRVEESGRVRLLASQYLNYHGNALNRDSWEAWRMETIPDFPADYEVASRLAGLSQTSSMQALYTPSPQLDSTSAGQSDFSPDLDAFSPRPDATSKMMSIVEALGESPSLAHLTQRPQPSSSFSEFRSTLDRDGLTRDVLVRLDTQLLARSLSVFHLRALSQVPSDFTAELCFGLNGAQNADEPESESSVDSPPTGLSHFLGNDEDPHWLTKMILFQVLVPESGIHSAAPAASSHLSDTRHAPTSRTHTRSEVISAWARVGEVCRRTGDECSWRAIFSALCSRPIARLEKVWSRVDSDAISVVQSWIQLNEKGDSFQQSVSVSIPWAGEAQYKIRTVLEQARCNDGEEWKVGPLSIARQKFEALRTTFSLCMGRAVPNHQGDLDGVESLAAVWRRSRDGESISAMASKFVRIDQFMSLSLAAEPRRKGLFEPFYWTRPAQQPSQTLTAVLFPEPLPTVAFINRDLISRGRLESSASVNVQDLQNMREVWANAGGTSTMRTQKPRVNAIDLGGTMLPVYDGELLLLVQPLAEGSTSSRPPSRAPSRPPSAVAESTSSEKPLNRNPSIRVSPGTSHGLDRKPSALRRNSLPSLSQRTSLVGPEVSSDKPLRVVVQAGTLDRLVDVLVHGLQGVSVAVSDDNGEMPLTDTKTREVKVDMDDFSNVWWNGYRSFMTPQILFEFLRKRYLSARLTPSPSLAAINGVVRLRSEVLDTMTEWMTRGSGAQDVLDDLQLYNSFRAFLNQPLDHDLTQMISADDESGRRAIASLDQIRTALYSSFVTQTLRPSRTASSDSTLEGSEKRNFGSEIPNIDEIDAEELVKNMDAMVSAAFRNVNQEDLFVIADLLEVQSADRTGWFLPREPSSIADEVEIQSMNSYIVQIEPSSMISELTQDSLYRLLPPSIRSCIRTFGILRKWLISKLVAPKIGLHARQVRMELMLRAIEVCRLRNAESTSTSLSLASRPCVRSSVEAIVTSAVLSVESRLHYRAWQNVAIARGVTCEALTSLLSRSAIRSISSRGVLTVDVGWIFERMLEIISTPDVLESSNAESTGLVNFDKRRSLHTLITSTSNSNTTRRLRRRQLDRRDYERLNSIEKESAALQFDLRSIREEAYREATQAGPLGSKKNYRPFQLVVMLQQEKIKRDRHLRDRLSREKRQEQLRNDKREEYLNKAMNVRKQVPVSQKQHRNKKSMSSAFFQFMRPISSAFSSESLSSPAKRTPAELDFIPNHKPSLVLSVVDARVAQFVNTERSFTFQLDTEDGGHYLLQAINKPDMKKWMDTIQHVSKVTAKRRLTYLGQNSKMQLSDHLLGQTVAASEDPRAVFGVELDILLQREAENGEVQPGAIPTVLERLICEVESRGLTEIGIYRIAGAHSEVNAFKDALNRGEWPITSNTDIHAVCDLIKSWFRVLPGGIFSASSYNEILQAVALDGTDLSERLSGIRKVVHALPGANFDLLKRIVEHLEKVTDYEENNQMTAESLATVFSPNLLRSPNNDISVFFANMSAGHRVTKLLIAHFHSIFDTDIDQEAEADVEPDLDGEQEPEQDECYLDEPIPEEDEDVESDVLVGDEDEDEDVEDDNDAKSSNADDSLLKVSADPPVLDINLGSPHSLSFSVTS
ncbi:uncharacterized protein FIBRA_05130 [Fibroporia radiculosa]|uniref:Rho-GAP domain-containing protein n=1 Tax=Fibroporia radiculosa TaxID=599839 RepID=J4G8L6_9APHY|nr:uncharacterized protein FIBRA_05130 [Fibroporia radiculosa]CCM03013.1 predicted protein [Fibroporia radiculosa]